MPQDPESLALAADFPTPDRDEWRALVAAVLARTAGSAADGSPDPADPEDALASFTYDGIRIAPLYTAADAPPLADAGLPGRAPYVRGSTAEGAVAAGWDVRTRPVGADAAELNRAALQDLETGASSLWLAGVAPDDLPSVLEGVYLDLAPIALDAGAHSYEAARALLTIAEQRGVDPGELRGTIGADPIGWRARTGAAADLDLLARLAGERAGFGGLRLATVDATIYHEAGASDGQELGIATAVGVAYLRGLTDAGLDVDAALDAVEFRWAVTAEQFPSIAKLRAARRVWARVAELSGASAERRGQYQHAVTSGAMLTRRDPWVNLLRTTIGCFAAAIGGADAITVTPFDAAIGRSDDFARRIARNTQSILHDESSLARVIDAGGGSWFVESLTDQLADRAWDVFTAIERAGGALAALDSGMVESLVAEVRDRRADDVAHRRAPITGVSEFADIDEVPVVRAREPEPPTGLLPRLRYAEVFECFRDRADATPERPTVHLVTMGAPSAWSARAGFAANLFAAGGVATHTGTVDDFPGGVACICGPDRMYVEAAAPLAADLRRRGARFVWLAGRIETDGVDGYLHAGCDVPAVLTRTLETLEVPA